MTAVSEIEGAGVGWSEPLARPVGLRRVPRPVWLVLHDPSDAAGPALAFGLQEHWTRTKSKRAEGPTNEVPEVLALSAWALQLQTSWTLRVDGAGTNWCLTLANGRVLDDTQVVGVINRLGPLNPATPDAEVVYQTAEWSALLLAWLHGLKCPVLNRPRPSDPYPRQHDRDWWRQQAARAGLPISSEQPTATAPHPALCHWLVAGQRLVPARNWPANRPPLSAQSQQAMRRLARLAGCDLLAVGATLAPTGDWQFASVDLFPRLDDFGIDGNEALVLAMVGTEHRAAPSQNHCPPRSRASATARRAGLVAVLGRQTEGPCHLLLSALKRQGAPSVWLDQSDLPPPGVAGVKQLRDSNDHWVDWDALHGLYLRPGDTRRLGLSPEQQTVAERHTQAWSAYAEWAPVVVVNRLSAMMSNSSKPLQSQVLAALGFAIPPMLLTTCPATVRAFEAAHGPLIYKSASGVRSIVKPLDAAARRRLEQVRHAPTLFQKQLRGTNVRVHVVGEKVFATEIDSGALDYRYAGRQGQTTELRATHLSLDLQGRCRQAAEQLGLSFAGLDLMLADDGQVYCFEANPSPGYSWYEDATGQDISGALAALLSGREG